MKLTINQVHKLIRYASRPDTPLYIPDGPCRPEYLEREVYCEINGQSFWLFSGAGRKEFVCTDYTSFGDMPKLYESWGKLHEIISDALQEES